MTDTAKIITLENLIPVRLVTEKYVDQVWGKWSITEDSERNRENKAAAWAEYEALRIQLARKNELVAAAETLGWSRNSYEGKTKSGVRVGPSCGFMRKLITGKWEIVTREEIQILTQIDGIPS